MFITFEGPDGSGKTTQIGLLADALRRLGHDVVTTREPGGTPVAEEIRALVLRGRMAPEAETLLFLAARAEHVRHLILPALERGALVICDRFTDSTLAYQGYGLGLGADRLRPLCEFAALGLVPDVTFLLVLPVETALERRGAAQIPLDLDEPDVQRARDALHEPERRGLAFHRRVLEGYLREAERDPQRIIVIDATRPVRQVRDLILREVLRRLRAGAREATP